MAELAGRHVPVLLSGISSRTWEHPADRGALVALRQLKGFDLALRKLASLWNERALRLLYVGSAVRVDERQLPRLHAALVAAAEVLDVESLPELYLLADRHPQAMAIGVDRPFVVFTSGLVELLDGDGELEFVAGHELGHVLSGHALYTTMLLQLMRLSASLGWLPVGALGLRALVAALGEWSRKAELSCDRAGLLACQDPAASLRVHMKLAGGGDLSGLDSEAFLAQGEEYLAAADLRDSVLKLLLTEARSHPFAVVRAAELHRWVEDGAYEAVLAGDYPRREDDATASVRDEVTGAAQEYRDAFERSQDALAGVLRDLGYGVGSGVSAVRGWVSSAFDRTAGGAEEEPGASSG